jgi:putative transposase
MDRLLWVIIVRLWPEWRKALVLVKPDTVIAWHRKGFQLYCSWKSRRERMGRPWTPHEIRTLIRDMGSTNVLWGAPRLHRKLLKLGIEVSWSTVPKYMVMHRKPPSQTWRTFLENHVGQSVSVDFFVVPTVSFRILYVFLVLAHERRRVVHFNVTEHPTTEWTAAQLTQAFPWDTPPRYLLRDRDPIYGDPFRKQAASMQIAQVLTPPRSPCQSPFVERLIGAATSSTITAHAVAYRLGRTLRTEERWSRRIGAPSSRCPRSGAFIIDISAEPPDFPGAGEWIDSNSPAGTRPSARVKCASRTSRHP